MLITNGIVYRNINPARLSEYTAKGYTAVKTPEEKKPVKKGKETAKA